jgi:hypothetical protein
MSFCTRYMYFFRINVLNALRAPGMMVAQHTYIICRRNTTVPISPHDPRARATAVRSTVLSMLLWRANESIIVLRYFSKMHCTFRRSTCAFFETHVSERHSFIRKGNLRIRFHCLFLKNGQFIETSKTSVPRDMSRRMKDPPSVYNST